MALFQDLLRKWFYTNSSSAASSDARIPLLTATGYPKGSDTMANLASVLGVWHHIDDSSITDLNDVLGDKTGLTTYFISPSSAPANMPSGVSSNRIFLEVYNASGRDTAYDIFQRMTLRGSNEMYVRYRTGTTWSEWAKYTVDMPTFYKNYNSQSALNTALGDNTLNETEITINAGSSYTITTDSTKMGIWSIRDTADAGGKMYFNLGFNAHNASKSGVDIISSTGGIKDNFTITKSNGWTFTINNVTSANRTIKYRKEMM